MLHGIGAGIQFSSCSSIGKNFCIFYEQFYCIYTGIQIVFNFIEITFVIVGNSWRYIPFGNSIDVFGGYIQRSDYRIKSSVYTLNQSLIFALKFAVIGAGIELTGNCCFAEFFCFAYHIVYAARHFFHSIQKHTCFILGICIQIYFQISVGYTVSCFHCFAKRFCYARNQPNSNNNSKQNSNTCNDVNHCCTCIVSLFCIFACLSYQIILIINKLNN